MSSCPICDYKLSIDQPLVTIPHTFKHLVHDICIRRFKDGEVCPCRDCSGTINVNRITSVSDSEKTRLASRGFFSNKSTGDMLLTQGLIS